MIAGSKKDFVNIDEQKVKDARAKNNIVQNPTGFRTKTIDFDSEMIWLMARGIDEVIRLIREIHQVVHRFMLREDNG
ncbi:hypothetical protein CW304_07400 [Bacillus sp. UFRGS-B20]|nr:hypothetical protein CW304_07400 [Bacillus sp. UFRGS-B20]